MKRYLSICLVSVVGLAASCSTAPRTKKPDLAVTNKNAAAAAAGEALPSAPPAEVAEASLKAGLFEEREELKGVPFDYDSAKLSSEALALLKANAEIMKGDPTSEFLVAGHCDERGTVAYNLALGQKRAKEVRDYYISLGVEGRRVATISYGKEQPLCKDSNDECWSQNRRAETRARAKK